MIKRFNEHITENNLNDILNDLSTQEIRSDVVHASSSNVTTYVITMNDKIIVSDYIKEYLFQGNVSAKYFLSVGGVRIKETSDIKKKIFNEIKRLNRNYNIFVKMVILQTTQGQYDRHIKLTDEYKERIEEFDIIKNNHIDWISLNSLFDFYGLEFNEVDFKGLYEAEVSYFNKD